MEPEQDKTGTEPQQDSMRRGMDRRDFLKGALAAGAVGAVGALTGCGSKAEGTDGSTSTAVLDEKVYTEAKWSFEIPPAAIPDSQITKTIETAIVVIGAGTAGLVCANKAAEDGAKVIIISKSDGPVGRGGSNFAMNTKLTKKLGLSFDIAKAYEKMMGYHSFRIDQEKWWLHANKSGEAMDWLIDKMVAGGLTPVIQTWYEDPQGVFDEYPGTHMFLGGPNGPNAMGNPQQDVVDVLASDAKKAGIQIDYKTKAVQLVRENNNTGRVTAVIAKGPDGTYIKYVGSKGVVLATGDYGMDQDMLAKYAPWCTADKAGPGGTYSGDGHKMGLWVGAAWQKNITDAPLIFNFGSFMITQQTFAFQGLLLNKNGVRYSNEDNVFAHSSIAIMAQPDNLTYMIWDSKFAERMKRWSDHYGAPEMTAGEYTKIWDGLAAKGKIQVETVGTTLTIEVFKVNTVAELLQKLGLPADKAKASIDRYNGFCKTGVDEDFHKRSSLLLPVETGPFYGCTAKPWLLIMCGGLRTNIDMQVLDKDEKVIPGLYAVGTMVGDMFANCYSTHFPGHNLGGRCVTFGYLTGKALAAGKI